MLNALAIASYWLLAEHRLSRQWVPLAVVGEHWVGGMATVALFTSMMQWCRAGHEGGDYTIQASIVAISTGFAHSVSGFSARGLGYGSHFELAALLALAGAFCAFWVLPHLRGEGLEDRDRPTSQAQ